VNRLPIVILFVALGCGKISKNEWIERFEPQMVDELCKPAQYFRSCYEVDEATCRSLTKAALKDCIAKASIPDQLDEKASAKAGGDVGGCAGGAIEDKLRADKHTFYAEKKMCSDPAAWGGQ
jgi:hypothetical protein